MKRIVMFAVFFISVATVAQERIKSFDDFWPSFRKAVLAYDVSALDPLVSYPLTVKGTMDYDPVKKITRDKIIATLRTSLSQEGSIDDDRIPEETNYEEIKRKVTIPDSDYKWTDSRSEYMTIANLEFKKIAGKWKLNTIYVDMTN